MKRLGMTAFGILALVSQLYPDVKAATASNVLMVFALGDE